MPPIDPTQPAPDDPGFELVDEADVDRSRLPVARPVRRGGADDRRLPRWVRGFLVLIALGLTTVFGIALWLNPYNPDGSRRSMATHTQLGLEPCNMVVLTGKPCPACGMTTSVSLLAHGDVVGSLQANWVGTLLALTWLAAIPWAVASAVRGRYYFVRSGEVLTSVLIVVFLVLMIARWAVVLLLT